MFGMGGSEIIVILIVALLFLGPDKLPEAAKQISKGIRDIKKQGRNLQQSIEDDETIGGAIRDLKSALRGDEPIRPKPLKTPTIKKPAELTGEVAATVAVSTTASSDETSKSSEESASKSEAASSAASDAADGTAATVASAVSETASTASSNAVETSSKAAATVDSESSGSKSSESSESSAESDSESETPKKRVFADEVGERDPESPKPTDEDDAELASMIRPASGSIARNG